MKKFYISRNYEDLFTATSKAKMDVEDIIVSNVDFKNIGLPRIHTTKRIGKYWTLLSFKLAQFRIPANGIFLGQYPTFGLLNHIEAAKRKNNKIIIIIHDLDCLRQGAETSLKPLEVADILIAHNKKMKEWLVNNGFKQKIYTLEIFDYLTDKMPVESPIYPKDGIFTICFAGNLGKSLYLNNIELNHTFLKLFGVGYEKLSLNATPHINYAGCFTPTELRHRLKSHFGLVWDGTSCETCDGISGEYLKYIAPHKLSMYLSSNLPVIVWEQSAMAEFVKINNIGITIDNLNNIDTILQNITQVQYNSMVTNAATIGEKIRAGHYLSSVLKSIDTYLL